MDVDVPIPPIDTDLPDCRHEVNPPLTRLLGRTFIAAVREHSAVLAILGAYFAGVAVFMIAGGQWHHWTIRWSYWVLWILFLGSFAVQVIADRRLPRPERIGGALLVMALATPFQSTFNSVKQVIDDVRGYPWDPAFASMDRWVHFGRHPWEWLAPLGRSEHIVRFFDVTYVLWFPVLFGFLLWVAWCRDRALRRRALISTVLVWVLCGTVAALVFASAGPCYYHQVATGPNPYAPLIDVLEKYHARGLLFARMNQVGLWNAMESDTWIPFGGISAMPSVHVAMTVLMALVARLQNRTAGMLLTLYAVVIFLGSILLGWHYAIDGYFGALIAGVVWKAVASLDGERA
jgi:hypothetical protein